MEQASEQIEQEISLIGDEAQQVVLPEIARFAKLLEKAVSIDKKMKIASLRNLMHYKVQWSLKEIDGLQLKIDQMINEEATIEFITHEKKIEH